MTSLRSHLTSIVSPGQPQDKKKEERHRWHVKILCILVT
jgi:hypothetical protein